VAFSTSDPTSLSRFQPSGRANGCEELCAGGGVGRAGKMLTSMNIPWIFRLQQDTAPTTALQMHVAAECGSGANSERFRNVLVSEEVSDVAFLPTGCHQAVTLTLRNRSQLEQHDRHGLFE
jgi:hypothetical protein